MFGRQIYVINYLRSHFADDSIATDNNTNRQESLDILLKDIQLRLRRAYDRTKIRYNPRHRPEPSQIHQLVWKKNYSLSDATKNVTSKLAAKFAGPFRIVRILMNYQFLTTNL